MAWKGVLMREKKLRELTGSAFVLSTLFAGAQQAGSDPPPYTEPVEDQDILEIPISLDRARVIAALPEWPGIRSIWRELDLIEPRGTTILGTDEPPTQLYSFGSMDWGKGNLMIQKVSGLGEGMTSALEAEGISTIELDLLLRVIHLRIELMSTGLPSMMTRMMPPPIEYDKGELIEELERRIDHLLILGDTGMLSVGQVRSATDSILGTFVSLSIVNAVSENYGYPYMYDFDYRHTLSLDALTSDDAVEAMDMADLVLADMERHFESMIGSEAEIPEYMDLEDLRNRYSNTLEAVADIRSSVTGLNYLLGDLLLGGN
jgi:hypothetical protein